MHICVNRVYIISHPYLECNQGTIIQWYFHIHCRPILRCSASASWKLVEKSTENIHVSLCLTILINKWKGSLMDANGINPSWTRRVYTSQTINGVQSPIHGHFKGGRGGTYRRPGGNLVHIMQWRREGGGRGGLLPPGARQGGGAAGTPTKTDAPPDQRRRQQVRDAQTRAEAPSTGQRRPHEARGAHTG